MSQQTKTLKEISINQLAAWIKKNPQVTWGPKSWGSEQHGKPGHLRGKYIDFNLDTRDMKIFRLTLRGAGEDIVVDFRDEGEGTLLDQLERIFAKEKKNEDT